jgi:peptide-methionine (S)-S-oxide reductase
MRFEKSWLVFLGLGLGLSLAIILAGRFAASETTSVLEPDEVPPGMERVTFGAGCFWCTEAVFRQLKGVEAVVAGYCGGSVQNPTYQQVCTGTTGHAEAVQVTYDPEVISFTELLEVFWQTHDPTTRDRQGHDVGPQYRSVIFYRSDEQRQLAEHCKQRLDAAGLFGRPIVTDIVPFREFYRAEVYHQDYFEKNTSQRYCQAIIRPKLEKLKKVFHDKLSNDPLGMRPAGARR